MKYFLFVVVTLACFALSPEAIAQGPGGTGAAGGLGPGGDRALRSAPESDTVAILYRSAIVQVVERSGGWTRIRVEGWLPQAETAGSSDTVVEGLGLAAIRADPERHEGSIVRWRVQHISLQRADTLRSDIAVGEPYLLVRDPGGEVGFVYVVVPPDQLPPASNLAPLQRFEIIARVRHGRSSLTGHPILDLLEIRP